MYFLSGAAKLNTPVHARLVPRMRRRLMQLTTASWAGATGLAALLAWGTPLSPAFVLLGMGTWLAILGLVRSGHRAGTVAQFMFFPAFIVPGSVDFARQHLGHGAGFAIAMALMLALAAFTLRDHVHERRRSPLRPAHRTEAPDRTPEPGRPVQGAQPQPLRDAHLPGRLAPRQRRAQRRQAARPPARRARALDAAGAGAGKRRPAGRRRRVRAQAGLAARRWAAC